MCSYLKRTVAEQDGMMGFVSAILIRLLCWIQNAFSSILGLDTSTVLTQTKKIPHLCSHSLVI